MLDTSASDVDPGMFRLLEHRSDRRRKIRVCHGADGNADRVGQTAMLFVIALALLLPQ
ncbi:hypothetical protein [Bradyrhizobium sp. USDA 4486]